MLGIRNLDAPSINDRIISRFYGIPVDQLTDGLTQQFNLHYDLFEIRQDMLYGQREEDWGRSGGASEASPRAMDELDVDEFTDDEVKYLVEGRAYGTPERPTIWIMS